MQFYHSRFCLSLFKVFWSAEPFFQKRFCIVPLPNSNLSLLKIKKSALCELLFTQVLVYEHLSESDSVSHMLSSHSRADFYLFFLSSLFTKKPVANCNGLFWPFGYINLLYNSDEDSLKHICIDGIYTAVSVNIRGDKLLRTRINAT